MTARPTAWLWNPPRANKIDLKINILDNYNT